jgi:tRNA dimethylallyltransferase
VSRTASRGIGYAEAFAVLDGELAADELVERVVTRTWRYAKRQRSWFRADPRCEPTAPAALLARWSPAGPSDGSP